MIAIDADPLGKPASLAAQPGTWQIWRKPLRGGRMAVAVVNLAGRPAQAAFSWVMLTGRPGPASVTDVWAQRRLRVPLAGLTARLPAHGTAVYMLRWHR
jgi:alpha-galactosidase